LLLSTLILNLSVFGYAMGYTVKYVQLPSISAGSDQEYPSSIAFDLNNGNVYVTDQANDTVNIISGQNDTVIGTINLDDPGHNISQTPNDIVFDARNGHLYVSAQTQYYNPTTGTTDKDCADKTSDLKCSVLEINDKNNRIINNIPVKILPGEIAFGPKNSDLYVLQYTQPGASAALMQYILVIDAKSNRIISTLNVGIGIKGLKIDFNPNNGNGYVTNDGFGYRNGSKGTVSVIDAKSNRIIHTIPVGVLPYAIKFSPNNKEAYVANQGGPFQ
jgi:YVTN family beta-propeller protein